MIKNVEHNFISDRAGIAWIFYTKDLLEETIWLLENVRELQLYGYIPIDIKQDSYYSIINPGKTKIVVILKNTNTSL